MIRSRAGWFTALLLWALLPATAAGQGAEPLWRWIGGQGGFCVWYLADPALAAEVVPAGTRLRAAQETEGLPPVLIRIMQDEPRFAAWIPGTVCLGLFSDVASDGVPVGHMDGDQPIFLALSALAVHDPLGLSGPQWLLTEIGIDAGRLDRSAEASGIPTKSRDFRPRKGVEGEDDKWDLALDGVKLAWSGHASGDSRVGSTRTMSFGYAGNRNSPWLVDLRAVPEREQSQVGALRIEGKGPLAQALKSSPIRMVGALELGGELTLTFRRGGQAPPR